MSESFDKIHDTFARAVRNPEASVPDALVGQPERAPLKRFNVYRNNHYYSLIVALGQQFPTLKSLLGEERFTLLAKAYAHAYPPRSPLMMYYGDAMPAFILAFAPTQGRVDLAELAKLEFVAREAYHAADAECVTFEEVASLDPEIQVSLRLSLHPACRFFEAKTAALSLWRATQDGLSLSGLSDQPGEEILITRPGIDVLNEKMPRGSICALTALQQGFGLEKANEIATKAFGDFDLGSFLALSFSRGAFGAYTFGNSSVEES